ncbi:MAG: cohesin domain-containing protein, partial [Defluviitaleaceae bacterium]|nr:cohesin domain-containing protein [Defluviitaleaceae bacterium]
HTRLVAGWEERIINDTPTLEISNAEGMAGEIIEVIVSLHNNAGTNMFSINFDLGPYGHYLEFLGATSLIQDPFSFFNYSGTPLLGTRWMSGVPTEQTELFALRFRIDPNVSVDYIPIFFDTADNNITSLNFVSISSLVELGQLELNDGSTGEFGIISILPALPLPQPILTINSANERIRPLDSVFIELSLEENLGVAVIEFDLNFDSDVLEFVDFTSDSAGTGTFDSNIVRWEADENATFESLFTMEFIVPNNAFDSAINTTVVVNTIQALDISGEEIPIGLPIFANNNAEVDVYVFWGDVNFAGEAPNIFSANTLMNYITGMPGILIDRRAANVDWTPNINGDQVLDMADAMTLFNYALGLPMIPSLPHNTHLARTRLAQEVAWNSPADIKSVINPTDTPNEFELSVHISNNPGIAAYHLMLEFDNNIITPISIAQGDDFNNSIFVSNLAWVENSIKTTWLSETINYNDGVLFTVLFRTDDIANLSNIVLSAIDVLSYDLANRFRVINVVTNINPTPFVMEIDHVDIVNDEDYKEDKESSEEYSNIEYSTYQEYVVQPQ